MPEVLVTKLPSSLKRQISGEISCEGQRQTRISDIVSDFLGEYSFFSEHLYFADGWAVRVFLSTWTSM